MTDPTAQLDAERGPSADTIVAVSSPPGRSLRGLLRASGPNAIDLLGAIWTDARPAAWDDDLPPRRLVKRRARLAGGTTLPVLAMRLVGPRSYTGEDMLEVQVPGHPALLERMLGAALAAGARLAEPGEFTCRAFMNGKLDLTQAEGVAATIEARSDAQLAAAGRLRAGELGRRATALVEPLADTLALVEAGVDFTDQEDVTPIAPDALRRRLLDLQADLARLRRSAGAWRTLDALPRVVLAGPPSAGKSTLFNAMIGQRRMVTHDLPGTTRDVVEEPLTVSGDDGRPIELLLVDLAGLDEPHAVIDHAAQAQARAAVRTADLVLAVHDGSGAASGLNLSGKPTLTIRAKADLAPRATASEFQSATTQPATELAVSALTGEGIEAVRRAIGRALSDAAAPPISGDTLYLQPRHEQSLEQAGQALAQALGLIQASGHDMPLELVAGALRAALDALAELGGAISPDDLIGRVFARFCVGK